MPADVSAALPFSSGRREISALDVFIELSLTELQWAEVSGMALLTLSDIRSSPTSTESNGLPRQTPSDLRQDQELPEYSIRE